MHLLFKFLKEMDFMCMSGLPACIHVYHMHVWYLALLQKQQVLLTAEPFLRAPWGLLGSLLTYCPQMDQVGRGPKHLTLGLYLWQLWNR